MENILVRVLRTFRNVIITSIIVIFDANKTSEYFLKLEFWKFECFYLSNYLRISFCSDEATELRGTTAELCIPMQALPILIPLTHASLIKHNETFRTSIIKLNCISIINCHVKTLKTNRKLMSPLCFTRIRSDQSSFQLINYFPNIYVKIM